MTINLFTRMEQSTLMIEAMGRALIIDIGTLTPAENLDRLPKLDAALVSHQHGDHFALDHLRAIGAPVYGPADVVMQLYEGMAATVLRPGETVDVAGFAVTPVLADHGPKLSAPIDNLGFVIRWPGHVLYFAGDIARSGTPPAGPFDTVVVPVGGAGFVFSAAEALEYLDQIGHRGRVIPVHDTGPSDPDAVARFMDLAPGHLEVTSLDIGDSVEVQT